jgi:hypothetical protein
MEIVVNWAAVTVATVIVGFILNQALVWAGVSLSANVKKGIVFVLSVAMVGYFAYSGGIVLPDPGADPFQFAAALLAVAAAVFKVAQSVYDKIWEGLVNAK